MNLTDLDLDILKDLPPFKCNEDIDLRDIEKVDLSNLVSCDRNIYAPSAKIVKLEKLKYCGKEIIASSATTVELPNLESCGEIDARLATTLNLSKDRKSTRLNSSHTDISRMPSSA